MANNAALLKEIRERFDRGFNAFSSIRSEGEKDMGYITGLGVWDDEDTRARTDSSGAKRPKLIFDEFRQYVNQVVNDVRMNEIAIQVDAAGNGASDKTARLRSDAIRAIQYDSQAQEAFTCGYENAVMRGYGVWRVSKQYKRGSFDQELLVKRIQNPNSVVPDPDTKEANGADMRWCFVLDTMTLADFRRKYPRAEQKSFSQETMDSAPAWFKGEDSMQVAEYWVIETERRTLLAIDMVDGSKQLVYQDELKEQGLIAGNGALFGPDNVQLGTIARTREEDVPKVVQYITNGVEILAENQWDGMSIPIVFCWGQEFWYEGKRLLYSLVRLARDPAKLLDYARSTQLELAGLSPKTPWMGVAGQFDGFEDQWKSINTTPHAFIEYNAKVDADPSMTLGPPVRVPYDPPIQALEVLAESARRAIQSAMGLQSLPTSAQRQNEKSGIALKRIADQQMQGSYHLKDNYLRALERTGRILNELLDKTYDTARHVATMGEDEKRRALVVNADTVDQESGEPTKYEWGGSEHSVIIKTGNNYADQRQEANEFAMQLASPEMVMAGLQNQKAAAVVAKAIRLRNGGAIMNSIADDFDPQEKDGNPAQMLAEAQGQLQQAQQVVQALNAHAAELEKQLQAAQAGNETKLAIAAQNNETKLVIEELKAAIKESEANMKAQMAAMAQEGRSAEQRAAQAHEVGMEGMRAAQMPEPQGGME